MLGGAPSSEYQALIGNSYIVALRVVQALLPEPEGEGNKTCTAQGSYGITVI